MNRAVIVRAVRRHLDRPAGRAGRDVTCVDRSIIQSHAVSDLVVVLEHHHLTASRRGIGRKRLRAVLAGDGDGEDHPHPSRVR